LTRWNDLSLIRRPYRPLAPWSKGTASEPKKLRKGCLSAMSQQQMGPDGPIGRRASTWFELKPKLLTWRF
jgi:hypothetical protein